MTSKLFKKYAEVYKNTLLKDVIPFWEMHSLDQVNGGYYTCLNRQGVVYDTDKFVWLQGRQAWVFSMLYNKLESKQDWFEISKLGVDFLLKHARSPSGDFYFALNAAGDPLIKPYNIFSDCFAAMALSQYAKAAKNDNIRAVAVEIYRNILSRRSNPKGVFNKHTTTRPLKDFALSMILSNLVLEMEDVLSRKEVDETLDVCITEVMGTFLNEETGLILEYVSEEGSFVDCFEGRLINPGHGLEAMWFMLDIGVRRNDQDLIQKAILVMLSILEFGWDQQHGGLFYFMDLKGHPPQQLEWDQKLWWVHSESLVALAKAFSLSKDQAIWDWYQKVHSYTWGHFPDPEYGEWYGYLNRQGKPHLSLKGGKWKGCFHLPRALFQCWQIFEKLAIDSK
ncbi:MAG: N-acylglucosamine 2-epimerase [Cyclobacteriaceae bacterium]|nr:MAG: N-acylglucosamine 2-epimerase [Cyclobacteriaceae bacterium]